MWQCIRPAIMQSKIMCIIKCSPSSSHEDKAIYKSLFAICSSGEISLYSGQSLVMQNVTTCTATGHAKKINCGNTARHVKLTNEMNRALGHYCAHTG